MRVYYESEALTMACCKTLAFLSKYAEVVDYLAIMNIAKLVLYSMQTYKDGENVMYCAQVVMNTGSNEQCVGQWVQSETVQLLLRLCEEYIKKEETLFALTAALYVLAKSEVSHASFGAGDCVSVFTSVLDVWMNRNNDEILCNVLLTVFYCYKVEAVLAALKRSTLLDLIIRVVVANLSKALAKAYAMLMLSLIHI